jgi:O-antigen ligase
MLGSVVGERYGRAGVRIGVERVAAIGRREEAALSAPPGRIGLALLLAVLVLVAVPYFDAGMPASSVLLSMLVPFSIALRSPVLGVALLCAVAPFSEVIARFLVAAARSRDAIDFVWIEPMFLGAAAAIVVRLLARPSAPRRAPAAAWLYVAIVVCALSVQVAGYLARWQGLAYLPLKTLWSAIPNPSQLAPEHTLRAALLLLMGPLWLWLVRNAAGERGSHRVVWLAWVGGAFVFNVCAIAMWIYGLGLVRRRFTALFEDPNSYSSYLTLTLFAACYVVRAETRTATRAVAVLVIASTGCLILLAGSKIGMLAAFLGVSVVVMVPRKRRWQGIMAFFALAGLWAGAMLAARYLPGDIGRMNDPSYLVKYAGDARWAVWSASTRVVAAHPMAGIGPGLLCRSLNGFYREGDTGWRPAFENAHNYFLQLAAETGIFAPLAFLLLIAAALRPVLGDGSSQNRPRRLLVVGVLCYLATLLTGHALLLSRQTLLFWGFLGALSAPYEIASSSRPARRAAWLAIPLFLAAGWIDQWPNECRPGHAGMSTVTATFDLGFYPREDTGRSSRQWMKDAGEVHLCNRSDRPVAADVAFEVLSFGETRNLAIDSRGQRLADFSIGMQPTTVRLERVPLAPGPTSLLVVPSPGARRVGLHKRDGRPLSVSFLGEPRIFLRPP